MAKLIAVKTEYFRAFSHAELDLPQSGLTLVAGPNNVGKSALLSALDAVAGRVVEGDPYHRYLKGGAEAKRIPLRIYARWSLTDMERVRLLGEDASLTAANLLKTDAIRWIEWKFIYYDGDKTFQPVEVSGNWTQGEEVSFGKIELQQGMISHPSVDALAVWDRKSWTSTQTINPSDAVGSFLKSTSTPLAAAARVLNRWRTGYFHFAPLRRVNGRSAGLSGVTPILQSDGSNLASVLLHLQTNSPQLWQQLIQMMREIIPGVGWLMTPVNENACEIVFRDDQVRSHLHNIKDLGTGVEQILMTLVVGLTRTASSIVLEEPETGLEAGAQRALLGLLQDWAKDRLIIASTHSATMLDWNSPSTQVVAVSRSGTESAVAPVGTQRAEMLRGLGVRLSDVLSADRILIVEGPTEREIFDVWFPDVTRSPHIAIIDGGGGYNARHAELFVKWLGDVDKLGPRRVLYARDRDELSTKFLEKLDASEYVFVLPCRELENLLLDFVAITSVINDQQPVLEVTPDEIETEARRMADSFKNQVVLKRTMADFADPIRLVDNRMRRYLSRAEADLDTLIGHIVGRLPEKSRLVSDVSERWRHHQTIIFESWDTKWLDLVPGADLLCELWKKYLARNYRKTTDGPAIAHQMTAAPQALNDLMRSFMTYSPADDF